MAVTIVCDFCERPLEIEADRYVFYRAKSPPQSIEDPWMEVDWLFGNKPEWCPLKPVEEV